MATRKSITARTLAGMCRFAGLFRRQIIAAGHAGAGAGYDRGIAEAVVGRHRSGVGDQNSRRIVRFVGFQHMIVRIRDRFQPVGSGRYIGHIYPLVIEIGTVNIPPAHADSLHQSALVNAV